MIFNITKNSKKKPSVIYFHIYFWMFLMRAEKQSLPMKLVRIFGARRWLREK